MCIGLGIIVADLVLVRHGHVINWWRLGPSAGGVLLLALTRRDILVSVGMQSVARRPKAILAGVFIAAGWYLLTRQPSPFSLASVDCIASPGSCLPPYWAALEVKQMTVLAPLVEESVYRYFGYGVLARAMGPIPAAIISVGAFSYLHYLYHIFHWWHVLAGILYVGLFSYGRSLALNIATHSLVNWGVLIGWVLPWVRYYEG
jgi:membrane protease YdiL (CAAX protease family)